MGVAARILGLAMVVLAIAGCTGTASTRTRLITTDDPIMNLGPMPEELRELHKEADDDTVGFRYRRFAVLDADVWSWGGTLIFYREQPEISVEGFRTIHTTYYHEVDDALADRYGWGTPIEYRIPVGLLVALCIVEFLIVARKRRTARRVLAIGIGLIVFSGVLFLLGMTWQCAFPLMFGFFHIVTALPIFQPTSNAEAAMAMGASDDEEPPYKKPQPDEPRPSGPVLGPAPTFEKDPFRAPPQPPPIQVKRPPTAPATAPVVRDENAEGPKLLR
ncbi:MAG: hypothetical protein ACKV2T_43530 [Kofleriaceae bacterium]